MQQQELAQMRQRDANLTALAAIGPRKKRKVDSPGTTPSGTEVRIKLTLMTVLSIFCPYPVDTFDLNSTLNSTITINFLGIFLINKKRHFLFVYFFLS